MSVRPVEIHVNSRGAKEAKFQEVLHSNGAYLFLPIDGEGKTRLFNVGRVNGTKRPIPLYDEYDGAVSSFGEEEGQSKLWLLVIEKKQIAHSLNKKMEFTGSIGLSKTFLLLVKEASEFLNNYCMECEFYGTLKCFRKMNCTEAEYDKYVDGPWRERRKEEAQARRERKAHKLSPDTGPHEKDQRNATA